MLPLTLWVVTIWLCLKDETPEIVNKTLRNKDTLACLAIPVVLPGFTRFLVEKSIYANICLRAEITGPRKGSGRKKEEVFCPERKLCSEGVGERLQRLSCT